MKYVFLILIGLFVLPGQLAATVQDLVWLQLPVIGPSARYAAAAAYDRDRDRLVLHGGSGSRPQSQMSDTWEFDGSKWELRSSGIPSRVSLQNMIYDERARQCVLIAYDTFYPGLLTWTWSGVRWDRTGLPPRNLPVREDYAMAYSSRDGAAHFHGGYGQLDSGIWSDHWSRPSGGDWSRLSIYTMPERYGHAMSYDRDRDRLVIFGGQAFFLGTDLNDTWEWDGSAWTQAFPAASPPLSFAHRMIYFESMAKTVLITSGDRFVGPDSTQTWTWDGTNWTRLSIVVPLRRARSMFVYDSTRQRAVLFGGGWVDSTGKLTTFDDTWVLVPACKANCSQDATPDGRHRLDIQDFACFQNAFALGDLSKADCTGDGTLSIADFTCFQNAFALGCP